MYTKTKNQAGPEVIGSMLLVMLIVVFMSLVGGFYISQAQNTDTPTYGTIDFEIYPENDPSGNEVMYIEFTVDSFPRGEQMLIIYQPKDQTKKTRYRYFGFSGEEWKTSEPSTQPTDGAGVGDSLRFPHDPSQFDPSGPRLENGDLFYIIGIAKNGTRDTLKRIEYKDPDSL